MSVITVRPSKDASNPFYASFLIGAKEYSATGKTIEEAVGRLML